MDTLRKIPFAKILGSLFLLLMLVLIGRHVAAGPLNKPRDPDVKKGEREAKPMGSAADERAPLPVGGHVGGNGIVEPLDRETKVAPQQQGRIAKIHVKEGDLVEQGAVLAELESGAERAAVDAAEADVATARAELARTSRGLRKEEVDAAQQEFEAAKARAELSTGTFARIEQLAKTGSATPDELDRAKRQAEADQRTSKAAEARKLAAERGGRADDVAVSHTRVAAAVARRDQAKANLERLSVRAPITGQILQVKYRAGEFINPAIVSDPLIIMGDTRKLRVRLDVDERDVAKIKVGAVGYVTLSAFPGKRFTCKVVELGRRMGRKNVRTDDPTERIDTKILEVLLELDQPDGLVPGLRVTGYIAASAP